jgi:hypothetical protein
MLEKKMKDFIDFINLTFISHFNLYKHVFTNERDNQILNQEKQVYAPTEALCSMHLNESKHSSLFDYEVKLAELEKKEKKLNEYYHYERESLAKQEKNLLNLINNEAYSADKRADEEVNHSKRQIYNREKFFMTPLFLGLQFNWNQTVF